MLEKLKDSTKRLYSSLLSVTLVAGSLYVFISMVIPSYNFTQELRAEKASKEKILVEYKKALEETNRLRATYSSIEQFQSQLNQFLPIKEDLPPVVNQVYGLAALNEVVLSGMDFQIRASETSASKKSLVYPNSGIAISTRVTGNYDNVKRFIGDLETNLRLFDVSSINISGGGKKDAKLEAALTFDTYFQPRSVKEETPAAIDED